MPQDNVLKIGSLTLPHRAVFAPMAGFTDAACRDIMSKHGAGYTVSEMVSAKALCYKDQKTASLMRAKPNGAPYGVQLFGSEPENFVIATQMLDDFYMDFIDINMGCPAPKIVNNGAGSKLMLNPELCAKITESVVKNTKLPVTVKIRKGWDNDNVTAVETAKACEAAGAAAIAVHARTREEMYKPGIDLSIIEAVKNAVSVPVIGNGDITNAELAKEMIEKTGCDGVMLARAPLGDPWIFERVNAALDGLPQPKEPTLQARMNTMRRQIEQMVEEKGEYSAMPQARPHAIQYMRGLRGAATLRREACRLQYLSDVEELIATVFEAQRNAEDENDTEITLI